MSVNPDKPGVIVNKEALAIVDRKMGSPVPFRPSAHGVYASWDVPLEALEKDLSPEQKRQIEKSRARNPMPSIQRPVDRFLPPVGLPAAPSARETAIPLQAMKPFKALLAKMLEVRVILSPEQAAMLLEDVRAMPAPRKIYEAKAIYDLCAHLEKQVEALKPPEPVS